MPRLLAILLFATCTLVAQIAPTASMTGTVTDPSGAVIPAAHVQLVGVETGFERTVEAQSDGRYLFSQIPVGLYRIEVSASGFNTHKQTGIRLNVNTTTTLDVRLALGAVGESVSVSADADMVNTQTGTLSQVVQQQYIQELPLNGRNAATLIRMVPGVVTGVGTTTAGYANNNDTINISVNGTRGNEVNYRLDGATHMDNVTNLNATYPNPDALQEFAVQTSNYSAQYGNFSGAVVNVVTRSGSNQLHGSVFEFVRNGAINARNVFASQSDNLKRNQFGGAVGGPIARNRLFWFTSYQGTVVHNTSFTNIATVPSEALRRGDFNETGRDVTDPLTGKPFPGPHHSRRTASCRSQRACSATLPSFNRGERVAPLRAHPPVRQPSGPRQARLQRRTAPALGVGVHRAVFGSGLEPDGTLLTGNAFPVNGSVTSRPVSLKSPWRERHRRALSPCL